MINSLRDGDSGALTLVDNYSGECLEIEVGQNLKGIDVVAVMEWIKELRIMASDPHSSLASLTPNAVVQQHSQVQLFHLGR